MTGLTILFVVIVILLIRDILKQTFVVAFSNKKATTIQIIPIINTKKVTPMNKFTKRLTASSSSIRAERAAIVTDEAESAQENYLRKLKDKKRELDKRKLKLEDINVETELTTNVVKEGFNVEKWIKDLNEIEIEILNVEVEIEVAESLYKKWFKDTEAA